MSNIPEGWTIQRADDNQIAVVAPRGNPGGTIVGHLDKSLGNRLLYALTDALLREAPAASKPNPTSCGYCTYEESDGSLIEQCPACKEKDSKQEPQSFPPCKGINCGCTDGRSHSLECQAEHAAAVAGCAFIKQEPRAQAEPEVVAIADGSFNCVAPLGSELITLQSHREAMTDLRRANVDAKTMWDMLKEDYDAQREAIAKKDAALKEIVSKGSQTGYGKMALVLIAKAAIAQAREARK